MGFCTPEQYRRFLEHCSAIEKYFVDGGIILIKYWMEGGKKCQQRRFEARIRDPLRKRKLTPIDLESFDRWSGWTRTKDQRRQTPHTIHPPSTFVPPIDPPHLSSQS